MKRKKSFIFSIVFFVISVFWFIGAITFYNIYKPLNENDTIEITGNIAEINSFTIYSIFLTNYSSEFYIFYEESLLDLEKLNSLAKNDFVTIKINKNDENKLNDKNASIEIVSLETDGEKIISLESYNNSNHKMQKQSVIGFCVGGVLFLIIAIIFMLWHTKVIGNNKNLKIEDRN